MDDLPPEQPAMRLEEVDWIQLADDFRDIRDCVRERYGSRYDRALRFAFSSAHLRRARAENEERQRDYRE